MPDNVSQTIDIKKIHPYVVHALNEFGLKKWGMSGLIFKQKNYKIYYVAPKKTEFGTLDPQWIIVSTKNTLYAKGQQGGSNIFKHPGYKLHLTLLALEMLGRAYFSIDYGGHHKDTFDSPEGITDSVDTKNVDESELKQLLSEILIKDLEPCSVYDYELETSRGVKQVG